MLWTEADSLFQEATEAMPDDQVLNFAHADYLEVNKLRPIDDYGREKDL